MGEIADDFIDRAVNRMPQFNSRNEIVWVTTSGHVLRPQEMTDVHLIHVIHLIERRETMSERQLNCAPTYRAMVRELVHRGKLTWQYLDLPIAKRLAVTGWYYDETTLYDETAARQLMMRRCNDAT